MAIVYSPLNGTGLKPVTRTLKEMGYTNITVVKEQEQPDGNFPTCLYPNPEIKEAMALGMEYAKKCNAEEGAHLIYGFQHEVTEEILRKAVETGTLDKHLQKVEVHKGDTYFVPAGTVHGIGKGILIAEIQESSNVTYRVYDYDRVDKNGKKRELHFEKAVQVMNMKVAPDVSQKPRMVKYYSGCSRELLCRCKYFETEKIQVTKGFAFSVMDASFQVLMCLDGYGEVQTMDAEQKPMRFSKGETLFLPAGLGRCLVVGDADLIKIRC